MIEEINRKLEIIKYKDEWNNSHIKRIASNLTDGAHTSPDTSSSDVPFLSVVDLNRGILDFFNCLKTSNADYLNLVRNGCQPKINDVLFSKDGTIGESTVIKESKKFVVGSSFIICTPNSKLINESFLYYYLITPLLNGIARSFLKGTGIPRLSISNFGRLPISFPNLRHQLLIANYLDTKTQAIDKKAALLQQKIHKYKELRKSLINQTITKGLNRNIEFKESGIEWIGKIPKHWEVKRLKDVGSLYSGLSGKSGDDFNQDENANNKGFLPFTNIASNTYIDIENFGKVIINKGEKQNKIKKHDIFFLMSSEGYEDLGKAALLIDVVPETYLNSFCKGFRIANKQVVPKYLNWMLFASVFRERLLVQGKGFTRINLKMEKINDFEIILPTQDEQKEITQYLDTKTSLIDSIIANIEKQIAGLAELRKTLINDVVTGKLKVTEDS